MEKKLSQFYNYREKYIFDYTGKKQVLQVLVSRKPVFNPGGLELYHKWDFKNSDNGKSSVEEVDFLPGYDEKAPEEVIGLLHSLKKEAEQNKARAQRRAKAKVFDYIMANPDLDLFCTLTLDAEKINRRDYSEVIKKFNTWADNRVRRDGFKYVAVPELHKDGAIHFHLLTNQTLPLIESGTYLPPVDSGVSRKKPLKVDTLTRKGLLIAYCQKVYNIPGWKYGFSTAMIIEGERARVASYIAKYITKTFDKVGGRYYLHGGELREPRIELALVNWDDFVGEDTFTFEVPGNEFAIIRNSNLSNERSVDDFTVLGK